MVSRKKFFTLLGWCIESWNSLQKITAYRFGWTEELNPGYWKWYPVVITTMTNLGAMVASFSAGFLVSFKLLSLIVIDTIWKMEYDTGY